MQIETQQIEEGVDAVVVTGAVDVCSAPELKEQLLALVHRDGRDVVVDFSACTFVDSAIVAALVSALHELANNGRRLLAVCPAGPVRRVFSLTGFDRAVTLFGTRFEAAAAVRAS
jgi:anti-sigma B factor antagonist